MGNIGTGFVRSIVDRDYDFIVLELSSFQLDGIKKFKTRYINSFKYCTRSFV